MPVARNNTPAPRPHTAPLRAPAASASPGLRRLWPLALLLCLGAVLWSLRHRIAFDPVAYGREFRSVAPLGIFLGVVAIYAGLCLRAVRWKLLLAPTQTASTLQLLPSQLMGFAAAALFGRVADLSRPYLVARKLGTSVATQIAVYSIERAFDLAAAAIIFSSTLAFAPPDLPHHEAFVRAGFVSLAATLFLAAFGALVRFSGDRLARTVAALLKPLSATLADTAGARLLEFREGFRTIATPAQFAACLAVSLLIWLGIAFTYFACARAFHTSPILAHISFTAVMLLMATSLGTSLLQLPILGWFTQIAAFAAAYRGFYGVPLETASACATVTFATTTLSVIPLGLIASRVQGVRLREATRSVPRLPAGSAGAPSAVSEVGAAYPRD